MKSLPLILFVGIVAAGCASAKSDQRAGASYPIAYEQALFEFPGTDAVRESVIDEFVDFLSKLGADNTAERADKLYAENLYFSDALMMTSSKAAVVKHFRGLVEGGASVEVKMLDVLVQDTDVYLVWLMTASFQPIRKTVTSKTIGITHARFNAAGKVVLHQDFWDTGLGSINMCRHWATSSRALTGALKPRTRLSDLGRGARRAADPDEQCDRVASFRTLSVRQRRRHILAPAPPRQHHYCAVAYAAESQHGLPDGSDFSHALGSSTDNPSTPSSGGR